MLNNIIERFKISNMFEKSQPETILSYSQNNPVPSIVRVTQMKNVQQEGLKLFERKNRDYGDAFARYGPIGVLIRVGDKISRLQSITKNGVVLVNDEQMRDTLIDLHNYSAMAVMLLDEGKELTIEEPTYYDPLENIESSSYRNVMYPVFFSAVFSSASFIAYRYFLSKR